jgi:tetratricopeptide (TPR) repeat protein
LFIPKLSLFNGTIRSGLTLQNIFGSLQFDKESSPLPFNTKLSVVYKTELVDNPLTTGIEFNLDPQFVSLAAEYFIMNIFAIRCGYKISSSNYVDKGLRAGFSIGVKDFKFDYAYTLVESFGDTHRISLSIRFGMVPVSMNYVSYLVDKHYKKAMSYINNNKFIPAYRELMYVTKLDPLHPQAKQEVEKIENMFKQVQEAREKEKLEKEIRKQISKAKSYFDKGDLVKAKELFEIILKLYPQTQEEVSVYIQKIDTIQKEAIKQRINVYLS